MFQQPKPRLIPGVLFIEDFEVTAPAGREVGDVVDINTPPDAPTSTEAGQMPPTDIEQVRADAYEAGFAAGSRTEAADQDLSRLLVLKQIQEDVASAMEAMQTSVEHTLDMVANVALSLLMECFPAFCDRHGTEEMLRVFRSLTPTLVDEPSVSLTVPRQHASFVRTQVELLAERSACRFIVSASDDLLPGDIRVSWQDGMASRDLCALRARVLQRLRDVGLLASDAKEFPA